MKTETRAKLVKLIEDRGASRPIHLARLLDISSQALHRHLKALVAEGTLVIQGNPPATQYALAGIPDYSEAFRWMSAQSIKTSPSDKVCETRDIFTARLSPLKGLIKKGLNAQKLPLFISAIGEVGNNCFDHNLGQWRDVPGCWFEVQVTGDKVWVCIADRGQGIFSSLSQVDSTIPNDQNAIEIAFERFVSGRAPEKRGNGLKYVKKTILGEQHERGLSCMSGKGRMQYGDLGQDCERILKGNFSKIKGTLTLMVWRLE